MICETQKSTVRSLVLLAALALPGTACVQPVTAPAKTVAEVPTPIIQSRPRSPAPGTVDLRFEGAFSRSVKADGAECWEWETDYPIVYVSSANVVWPQSDPTWLLSIGRFGPDRTVLEATFSLEQKVYRTSFGVGSPSAVTYANDAVQLDLLLHNEANAVVSVQGTVRCPEYQSEVPVPPELVEYLKSASGTEARSFATFDFGRERDPQSASIVIPEDAAVDLVHSLRSHLPTGWTAFIGTNRWLGQEEHDGVELVVGPVSNQFDILRLARSDAVNYGMGTEALVKKLRDFDVEYGIDIVLANTDTVVFELMRMPPNLSAFAADVYAFCPDVVDQGVGSVDALEAAIRETGTVSLWWD